MNIRDPAGLCHNKFASVRVVNSSVIIAGCYVVFQASRKSDLSCVPHSLSADRCRIRRAGQIRRSSPCKSDVRRHICTAACFHIQQPLLVSAVQRQTSQLQIRSGGNHKHTGLRLLRRCKDAVFSCNRMAVADDLHKGIFRKGNHSVPGLRAVRRKIRRQRNHQGILRRGIGRSLNRLLQFFPAADYSSIGIHNVESNLPGAGKVAVAGDRHNSCSRLLIIGIGYGIIVSLLRIRVPCRKHLISKSYGNPGSGCTAVPDLIPDCIDRHLRIGDLSGHNLKFGFLRSCIAADTADNHGSGSHICIIGIGEGVIHAFFQNLIAQSHCRLRRQPLSGINELLILREGHHSRLQRRPLPGLFLQGQLIIAVQTNLQVG